MTKKAVKKTKRRMNRKLKRAVCTTMSAIFMISSITVAAIPVENLQANTADGGTLVTLTDAEDNMPKFNTNNDANGVAQERVYESEEGFQFVYVNRPNSSEKAAVIVGYSSTGSLPGGVLTIPDTFNGYLSTPFG
ncbi:MAG: hypothetical protein IJ711_06600, partial [Lachnospiraceae bacterium]|nr:hypothetical protein [Lachnospiraceae bacterium]